MQIEYEAKFLDQDHDVIRDRLKKLGAKHIKPKRKMKRIIFDWEGSKSGKEFDYVRLRDEGDKVTVTYKLVQQGDIEGVKELEFITSDFDSTRELFNIIGLNEISFQITFRETWLLDGALIELDAWPHIPTYIEIEASDEKSVKLLASKLELDWEKAVFGNVDPVYAYYYQVEDGYEITSLPNLTFDTPLPEKIKKRLENWNSL